jgi:hypothetical protein
LRTIRVIVTVPRVHQRRITRYAFEQLTSGEGGDSVALTKEGIKLDHLLHSGLGHTLCFIDGFDLLTQGFDPLRLRRQRIEDLCECLNMHER